MSQAGTLDDQQLQKINTTVDSSLEVLYQQESNFIKDVENRDKNEDKQIIYSTKKKPRTKALDHDDDLGKIGSYMENIK